MLRHSRVKARSPLTCWSRRTAPAIAILVLILLPGAGRAQQGGDNLPQVTIAQSPIPPGTVITMQNWQQYKNYMQAGLQAFFSGKYRWKFPPDVQLVIGHTHHYPVPTQFVLDTQRYSKLVKIVTLPDGGHKLEGYVAGLPFPNPTEPDMGWKLLMDMYYAYACPLECAHDTFYIRDRFGSTSTETLQEVQFRLTHLSVPGKPVNDPRAHGIYESSSLQLRSPEQVKYLTNLSIHYDDPSKPPDTFLFIPSLRRSLRLSTAAQCSPVAGSDLFQTDAFRSNFNGDPSIFNGRFLRDGYDLIQMKANLKNLANLNDLYNPLLFPKPSVGKFEVRPVWVLDLRRIPSRRAGFCYGKEIFYVDKDDYSALWVDAYDVNMKLWKPMMVNQFLRFIPGVGESLVGQQWTDFLWDMENAHLTAAMATDVNGTPRGFNEQCAPWIDGVNYDDVARYGLSSGLSEILR